MDAEPTSTVPPGAWQRLFASTLVRLYPQTGRALAEEIARKRCPIDGRLDPVYAAEMYALDEGAPVGKPASGGN